MTKAKSTMKITPEEKIPEETTSKKYRLLFSIDIEASDRGDAESKSDAILSKNPELKLSGVEEC